MFLAQRQRQQEWEETTWLLLRQTRRASWYTAGRGCTTRPDAVGGHYNKWVTTRFRLIDRLHFLVRVAEARRRGSVAILAQG